MEFPEGQPITLTDADIISIGSDTHITDNPYVGLAPEFGDILVKTDVLLASAKRPILMMGALRIVTEANGIQSTGTYYNRFMDLTSFTRLSGALKYDRRNDIKRKEYEFSDDIVRILAVITAVSRERQPSINSYNNYRWAVTQTRERLGAHPLGEKLHDVTL